LQGKFPAIATKNDFYVALAYTVRDRQLQRWINTIETYLGQREPKIVCYLSAEFLLGPRLANSLINLGISDGVRQSWWQSLPLGPTGYGNSPYQCLSSFAGSGLLISPDSLIVDGLLRPGDCQEGGPFSNEAVDYDAATAFKHKLLEKAWTNFRGMAHSALRQEYDQFCIQHAHWLNDYALLRRLSLFGFGERRIFCPDLP